MKTIPPVHSITLTAWLLPVIVAVSTLLNCAANSQAAAFAPGEILVTELGTSSIQRYSVGGTLVQTFTGTGTTWEAAALTPDGNLVTTFRSPSPGLNIFSPTGSQLASFVPPNGEYILTDVSVFADGTLAANRSSGGVQFWNQTGVLLKTVSLPGISFAFGSTVGSDGILYVADPQTNNLARVSASGVLLGNVSLSFSPGDLVMNPKDGTLWVSGRSNDRVEHIKTDGTDLGSFATGLSGNFDGIGLAPDNNSLYLTSIASRVVEHRSLNGNLLGSFALFSPSTPVFLTVVPAATPEPSSAALLLGGLALLAARRRRTLP